MANIFIVKKAFEDFLVQPCDISCIEMIFKVLCSLLFATVALAK